MAEETEKEQIKEEPQKFEGEFERFNDAEFSADGRVYVKEGELYIPELGVVCYGAGPCGKPSQELDTVMPCYHTAYIKTSDGKVYSRKDYQDIGKLKAFFNSHGNTLKQARKSKFVPAHAYSIDRDTQKKPDARYVPANPNAEEIREEPYKPAEVISLYNPNEEKAIGQKLTEKDKGLEARIKDIEIPTIKSAPNKPKEEKKPEKKVKRTGKVVEFPDEGTLFVATDLHGDMEALEKVVGAFEKKYAENAAKGKNTYLLTLGDDIHKDPSEYEVIEGVEFDDSYKVLDRLDELREKYGEDSVINLMGNHELAHLKIEDPRLNYVVKRRVEQVWPFEVCVKRNKDENALNTYLEQIKQRPILAITKNGIILTHTGPSRNESMEAICNLDYSNQYAGTLYRLLSQRIQNGQISKLEDYLKAESKYIELSKSMLKQLGANIHIMGHTTATPVIFWDSQATKTELKESYASINDTILIFSTGTNKEFTNGCFLELELGEEVKKISDIESKQRIRVFKNG
ncbi:MAG: metallophosphoesterase [Nanoarchaeota archaeon]|nr:metallophosphoesterase [Nanoarchaeota archaeon]